MLKAIAREYEKDKGAAQTAREKDKNLEVNNDEEHELEKKEPEKEVAGEREGHEQSESQSEENVVLLELRDDCVEPVDVARDASA
jgi:hypothetical protein